MEVHSDALTLVGTSARVSESNIQVSPVKHHYSQSRTVIEDGGVSNDQSVIFAPAGTGRVMESEIHLKGVNARSESIARMVTGGGTITNPTTPVGAGRDTTAFPGRHRPNHSPPGETLTTHAPPT